MARTDEDTKGVTLVHAGDAQWFYIHMRLEERTTWRPRFWRRLWERLRRFWQRLRFGPLVVTAIDVERGTITIGRRRKR